MIAKAQKKQTSKEAQDTLNAPFSKIIPTIVSPIAAIIKQNKQKSIGELLPSMCQQLSQITQPKK